MAKRLDVNYQLIYRLVREGELPSMKIGRVYRVAHEDLEAYLAKNRTGAKAESSKKFICERCGKSFESTLSLRIDPETGEKVCFLCLPYET